MRPIGEKVHGRLDLPKRHPVEMHVMPESIRSSGRGDDGGLFGIVGG